MAFEKPVGHSPKERHHVRFWRTEKLDEGRIVWIGSAAYDIGVELSRTTGQITHHISPDVDAERDLIVADLTRAGPGERHAGSMDFTRNCKAGTAAATSGTPMADWPSSS